MILHGLPKASMLSGISFVTKLPAPIVTLLPMVIPGKTTVLPPIQTLSPILPNNKVNNFFRCSASMGAELFRFANNFLAT